MTKDPTKKLGEADWWRRSTPETAPRRLGSEQIGFSRKVRASLGECNRAYEAVGFFLVAKVTPLPFLPALCLLILASAPVCSRIRNKGNCTNRIGRFVGAGGDLPANDSLWARSEIRECPHCLAHDRQLSVDFDRMMP